MTNDTKSEQELSTAKAEFLAWYEDAKKRGLKDIKFCPADVSTSTVETFLEEANAIRRAVESGKYQELSDEC